MLVLLMPQTILHYTSLHNILHIVGVFEFRAGVLSDGNLSV